MTALPRLDTRVVDAARRILSDVEHCTDPVATARLLPREVYTSEDFWEFEKHAVFGREWLCVAHVGEVPEPGDQLPLTVLDEPVVLVRDLGGEVRVLSAVCQHRGHPLFDGVGGAPTGCVRGRRMVCPYHNWQYELDGRLVAAPSMTETVPVRTLRETVALPEVRSEIFHGLVFVTLDPEAPPLRAGLRKLDEELQTWGLDELVPMPWDLRTGLGWNWKLHHDNALEPYHTAYVHRGVHEAAPAKNARFGVFDDDDGVVMHPTYLRDKDSGLASADGKRTSPIIPGLTEEQRSRVLFASVPPLLFGIFQPTMVSLSILLPTAAGSLDLRRINLYPKSAVEADGFDEVYRIYQERKAVAIRQDAETTEALQRGMSSRFAPRGPLSWMEGNIPHLSTWLLRRYRRALEELT
ncbi:aromatic ring-hydroxylating dioxygenase subunit alpha [Actinomycetospora sp. NBRC 106378]|uniref:aromatic ring-hydroxylating oxygenase subunit alpha n=1 Tax=Actinomycetospora sp. NBRC 106378 TaxID=3032208 RepID=UPI0024A311A7|nr:aromatic ring-hydroxylating dioxygenase subunit alpha [Actinomycetospora sp. NBRC 106378]GLZ54321.1 (2Fe-2S)-binding protein [Actinomycetospora sp. NBRC 106378]